MKFLACVQIKSEKETIPIVTQISVVNTNILIEEYRIPKHMILKIENNEDNNHVVVKFKKSIWGVGLFVSFDFRTEEEKKGFLHAIGKGEIDGSDVEELGSGMTQPRSHL